MSRSIGIRNWSNEIVCILTTFRYIKSAVDEEYFQPRSRESSMYLCREDNFQKQWKVLNFDVCYGGKQLSQTRISHICSSRSDFTRVWRGVLILHSRSFFTRIPYPALFVIAFPHFLRCHQWSLALAWLQYIQTTATIVNVQDMHKGIRHEISLTFHKGAAGEITRDLEQSMNCHVEHSRENMGLAKTACPLTLLSLTRCFHQGINDTVVCDSMATTQ